MKFLVMHYHTKFSLEIAACMTLHRLLKVYGFLCNMEKMDCTSDLLKQDQNCTSPKGILKLKIACLSSSKIARETLQLLVNYIHESIYIEANLQACNTYMRN
jgi:hypothetical protein